MATETINIDASALRLPAQAGENGKFLTTDGTNPSWGNPAGSGDVVGPASATNNAVALYNGTTGKLLKDGVVLGTLATQSGTFSGTSSGTNTGDQTNISGNAATVTTNANLTGPVTSTGNATAIANGAISNAMLANSAVANLSGTNTGDQTNISGNAATVTTNANLTGPVTSTGNATAIANGAISNAMLANAAVANLSGTNTGDNASDPVGSAAAAQAAAIAAAATHSDNASNLSSGTVPDARLKDKFAYQTADQNFTSTSLANITELVLPIDANGVYALQVVILHTRAAATSGIFLSLSGPTACVPRAYVLTNNQTGAFQYRTINAIDGGSTTTTMDANVQTVMHGTIVNGANAGNLQVRAASEDGGQVTTQIGSWVELRKLN